MDVLECVKMCEFNLLSRYIYSFMLWYNHIPVSIFVTKCREYKRTDYLAESLSLQLYLDIKFIPVVFIPCRSEMYKHEVSRKLWRLLIIGIAVVPPKKWN